MPVVINIVRKDGWDINPDDRTVNNIFRILEVNHGHCPTRIEDRFGSDMCPCTNYLSGGKCFCGLYVKKSDEC